MAGRTYGHYCPVARALDIVGERWALLVVRDLLVSPRRFTDLRRELRGIPSNILSSRLKQLEEAGLVERRIVPRSEGAVVYALTAQGEGLRDVVSALGRWGAPRLGTPRHGEAVTAPGVATALHAAFRPGEAAGIRASFELRVGEAVLGVRIADGRLVVEPGEPPAPQARISGGTDVWRILTGEVSPAAALGVGLVSLDGDAAVLDIIARVFRVEPASGTAA